MSGLPSGWAHVSLDDLGEWRGGGTPSKSTASYWRNGVVPWVSPKDMKRTVIEDAADKLSEAALTNPSTKLVPAGSVLIVSRSGILKHTLPVAVTAREVAINQDIKALIPHAGVDPSFVATQLRAEARGILRETVKSGMTVESIDFGRLRKFRIRVAPTNEQPRILAKLEPLLARCRSVRSELARVDALAMRQRRAVLVAAFRGSLVQTPRGNDGVPLGWTVVSLGSLMSERLSNGLSPRSATGDTGTLALKLTATTSGVLRLDANAVKRVDITLPPDSKYWLKPGDLLIQRANSLEHVGAAAIFEGEEHKYIYPDLMIRVRIADELTRLYVWRFLNSPTARKYFQDHATGTAGNMPKITGAVLSSLLVPLPPRDQMRAILDRIDNAVARLDAVKKENERCSRLIDKLEQRFLMKASSGGLVKQDARDEPIAVTLDRAKRRGAGSPKEQRRSAARLPESQVDSTREYVERQLKVWPASGIAFEQLKSDSPGTYEDLKAIIFELMAIGALAQRYDHRERKMKLVRSA